MVTFAQTRVRADLPGESPPETPVAPDESRSRHRSSHGLEFQLNPQAGDISVIALAKLSGSRLLGCLRKEIVKIRSQIPYMTLPPALDRPHAARSVRL